MPSPRACRGTACRARCTTKPFSYPEAKRYLRRRAGPHLRSAHKRGLLPLVASRPSARGSLTCNWSKASDITSPCSLYHLCQVQILSVLGWHGRRTVANRGGSQRPPGRSESIEARTIRRPSPTKNLLARVPLQFKLYKPFKLFNPFAAFVRYPRELGRVA